MNYNTLLFISNIASENIAGSIIGTINLHVHSESCWIVNELQEFLLYRFEDTNRGVKVTKQLMLVNNSDKVRFF